MKYQRYDTSWKQNISFSDDEEKNKEFIMDVSEDEEKNFNSDTPNSPQVAMQNEFLFRREDIEWSKLNQLIYLDEPGLQMFLHQDPDLMTLFNCFFPKTLLDMFQQTLNHNLSLIIRKDYPDEEKFQLILIKKKFGDNEVSQYIGMSLLFGVFRFPTVSSYWHIDPCLRGGIETCMQEGRYKFMENNMMVFQNEGDYDRAMTMVQDVRKKWRKLYQPDQELILYQSVTSTLTLNYLVDSETLYILDEVIMFDGDANILVSQMLNNFQGKNHLLYFSPDCLDVSQIMKLVENQIYPVGMISIKSMQRDEESRIFLNQLEQENVIYSSQKLCTIRMVDKVMVFPKCWGEDNQIEMYQVQLRDYLARAEKRITCIDLYKSPFSYQNQISLQTQQDPDTPININVFKILYEEALEGSIYNMFSFYNSILINNQPKQTFKQFKLIVAGSLIGEKFQQLEADRKELLRQNTLVTCQTPMQTDAISFGLPFTFETFTYHYPIQQERRSQVKYCVVCMKYENLTKSYFYCEQCQKQVSLKVFLCMFPCFEIYHKNPTLYIDVNLILIKAQQNELYFRIDQSEAANKELDMQYISRNGEKNQPEEQKKPDFFPQAAGKRRISKHELLSATKPNAKYAPSFYNWSYNGGVKQRNQNEPMEKNFEQMINDQSQPTIKLLSVPLNKQTPQQVQNVIQKQRPPERDNIQETESTRGTNHEPKVNKRKPRQRKQTNNKTQNDQFQSPSVQQPKQSRRRNEEDDLEDEEEEF